MSDTTERCDVLVIDDEPVVRRGVSRILEANGYAVTCVGSVRAAIPHPHFAACRLVLCDLMLPDQPGTDVLAALRERQLATPVIVITGYATSATTDDALAAGAVGVLAKPFDGEELLTAVTRVLNRAGGDRP